MRKAYFILGQKTNVILKSVSIFHCFFHLFEQKKSKKKDQKVTKKTHRIYVANLNVCQMCSNTTTNKNDKKVIKRLIRFMEQMKPNLNVVKYAVILQPTQMNKKC